MTEKDQHLVLIDGYGFIFRAFHALPPLKRGDGVDVGAIFGFTSMLIKVILEFSCSHIAVVLDSGGKTFRHDIYPDYKSHRPPVAEELKLQFPLVREAVSSLNISILEKQGFEADDLIATFAKAASNQGIRVTIFSSDKDLMQLIDDNISMYDPLKSRIIKEAQVLDKFGVPPKNIADILALMGDSADHVPGVPGIGPKTAAELIGKYHDIGSLYQNIDSLIPSKRKDSLIHNKELAMLSYKLVLLNDKVPSNIALEDLRIKVSHTEQFRAFVHQQNFKSLYDRADKICQAFNKKNEHHHNSFTNSIIIELSNKDELREWLKRKATLSGQITIILEADFLSIACDVSEVVLINFGKMDIKLREAEKKDFFNIISLYLNDSSIHKILHDVKRFYSIIDKYCVINDRAWEADDIELMSYLLNNSSHDHDLKTLINKYINPDVELELKEFLAQSTSSIFHIWTKFKQQLARDKLLILYERIEKPLSLVLYQIEKTGIKIDVEKLRKISKEFTNNSELLEQEIYQLANYKFNIASPKQLSEVLFERLNLPSKNAKHSTNAEVLENLSAQGHEIADKILNWRHLSKLNNTYTTSLIDSTDSLHCLHTNFQMTVTSTGRLSSINPNLQNIPIRSENGMKIRSVFIPRENNILISADYSQIELRLLAHMADVSALKQAFLTNKDIHLITASEIFAVPLDKVTPELRRKAKAINFGIIYGISGFGLANQLHINKKEAIEYIELYFNRYPEIISYMERIKTFARENGFVETIMGRRCYIKLINDSNAISRNFAERAAINAPLQGSAADIIKKSMILLHNKILSKNLPANILLQVHDELIVEASSEAVDEVKSLIKTTMESVVNLSVPMVVNINSGYNWAELIS
jgi:DNA polymerase I